MEYRKFTKNGETMYRLYGANGGVFSTFVAMMQHIESLRASNRI